MIKAPTGFELVTIRTRYLTHCATLLGNNFVQVTKNISNTKRYMYLLLYERFQLQIKKCI